MLYKENAKVYGAPIYLIMDRENLLQSFVLRDVTVTGKELGRGAFARAFEVEYRDASYAGKEIHSSLVVGADAQKRDALKDHVLTECYLLSRSDHPYIVKFIGIFYDAHTAIPNMVMEKMDRDLMEMAMQKTCPLDKMLTLLYDVSLAVCYLHSQTPPLLHRDLTAVSVLVNNTTTVAKISDFLFMTALPVSSERDSRKDFWQCAYTLRDHPDITLPPVFDYLPPEMFTDRQEHSESVFADGSAYGLPVDVFCFGVLVLCAIICGWPKPTELIVVTSKDGAKVSQTVSEVERRQQYLDKMIGEAEVLRPLVEECLDDDPAVRPTIATVCERIKGIKEISS